MQSATKINLTSNDLRIEVIEPLINSTIETLPYMGQDEYYSLPDSHEQGRAEGDLEVYDSRYATVESHKIKLHSS